jgi:hypothetical protein
VRVADKADDGVSFFCAAFARMDGRVKGGVCEKGGVGFDGRNANEGGAAARVARREGRQIHRSSFQKSDRAAETREILDGDLYYRKMWVSGVCDFSL